MSIGSNIREARLRLNLTQEELARRIGVTKNAISNYENNVSTPKFELLDSLMSVLEIDANTLFSTASSQQFMCRFSIALKNARISAGIPIEDACNHLRHMGHNLSPKTLSDYESGTSFPDVEIFLLLCEYYNIADIQNTFRSVKKRSFNFGAQISLLRSYLDLTKSGLASILNVSTHVVEMYESGQTPPTDDFISRLKNAFPVPDSFFRPNPPCWENDYFEDFIQASSDDIKIDIINSQGLDPRAYNDYFRIISQRHQFTPKFHLTDEERALVISYRSHPEMQAAVDTLLGLTPATSATKNA